MLIYDDVIIRKKCININNLQVRVSNGLDVLATASHYWPLDDVDGIRSLRDHIGNRTALRIHNHTVLPTHNSSSVYTNDSAYTNISISVDIVEGVVNKGIYLNGDRGATFLHFGNYKNSCISDPTLCGPQGITFSFFWKNQESHSRFAVMSGGKIISNGPFWTHILFTWTLKDGLKIYINGTFNISDAKGDVSQNYGDTYADLVIGTGPSHSYGHYVTASFDEFVIWERALSAKEIWLYYKAAIGEDVVYPPTTESPSSIHTTADAQLQSFLKSVDEVIVSSTWREDEEVRTNACATINEAVEFKDYKIQVASYLISLKVDPSPALSVNLSSEPLIRIMLTHQLKQYNQRAAIEFHLAAGSRREKEKEKAWIEFKKKRRRMEKDS
ncbi:Adhesion G-protein coupled receptor D1 [Bagarius yarrelli]|uniref:Adhesion G-protein coupled receptor D1 n=1 Tax=Bagarius yarrelli TaxID=175774 RepID=A0A556UFP0_BAGYA|nr:Adhesion G-protein coupled receptor D1 [Bagarius yarrelli]